MSVVVGLTPENYYSYLRNDSDQSCYHLFTGYCQMIRNILILGTTLQELKLQGIKICGDAVFSRYSRVKCFANDLSIFWASGRALDL